MLGNKILKIRSFSPKFPIDKNVTITAMNIPKIPKKFPCLEVSGEESPLSARINNTPEIR